MTGSSTWSLDDGVNPESKPGHHHDRWMVTYPRESLDQAPDDMARLGASFVALFDR
jgi:hypothetical protein